MNLTQFKMQLRLDGQFTRMLGRIVEGKDYSDQEITEMTWQKKSELIQNDPVTCARHYDHMVHLLINNFIKGEHKPIGDIHDFFYRVEFQQRSSPHIHALFWVTNAPVYGKNSHSEVASFVEKYVSCIMMMFKTLRQIY